MKIDKLEIKADSRGSLVEAFKLSEGQVHYVIVNPHESRGNHYHLRKTESFVVIYGSAEIVVKDRESGDVMTVVANGSKPLRVTISPNFTHRFTATDEGAILLALTSEQFNPDDPDTYPEEI